MTDSEAFADIQKRLDVIERTQTELKESLQHDEIGLRKAHRRIDEVDTELIDMKTVIASMKTKIDDIPAIKSEVEKFTPNLWKAVFMLIVILAGLAGVDIFGN